MQGDVFDKKKRSEIMSHIHSKNSNIEMIVRRYLHNKGFRYRLHVKNLPGKPDIVLPKYKCIIFVHGCFWHAHENCKISHMPKTNTDYWIPKIQRNIERDKKATSELKEMGWNVLIAWECEIKKDAQSCLGRLTKEIKANL